MLKSHHTYQLPSARGWLLSRRIRPEVKQFWMMLLLQMAGNFAPTAAALLFVGANGYGSSSRYCCFAVS